MRKISGSEPSGDNFGRKISVTLAQPPHEDGDIAALTIPRERLASVRGALAAARWKLGAASALQTEHIGKGFGACLAVGYPLTSDGDTGQRISEAGRRLDARAAEYKAFSTQLRILDRDVNYSGERFFTRNAALVGAVLLGVDTQARWSILRLGLPEQQKAYYADWINRHIEVRTSSQHGELSCDPTLPSVDAARALQPTFERAASILR